MLNPVKYFNDSIFKDMFYAFASNYNMQEKETKGVLTKKNKLADAFSRFRNFEERVYNILSISIAITLVLWPLLNSICCILLFAYWLFFSKKYFNIRSVRSKLVLLFSSSYLFIVVSSFYSTNTSETIFQLQQKLPLLVFPLVFGTTTVSISGLKRKALISLSLSTITGCLLCLANGLLYYFNTSSFSHLYGYDLVILKDMPPFTLGLCCIISIVFHLDGIQNINAPINKRRIYRHWMSFLFLSVFIFLLSNRVVFFCWILTILYYVFTLISSRLYRLITGITILLCVIVTIVFNPALNRQWNDLVDFSENNSIKLDADSSLGRGWGGKAIRLSLWICSWDVIKQHPLTGIGAGDAQDELQKAYETRKFYFASRYNRYNVHNQYLQITLASGVFALLVFIAGIVYPLKIAFKHNNILYIIFLLTFSLICITESILQVNKGIVWYAFFNALFFFSMYEVESEQLQEVHA